MADGNGTTSFERLIEIGIALTAERNINRLMEMILLEAKALTNADGGTLYIRGEMKTDPMTGSAMFEPTPEGTRLKFEIMRTDSLNIAMGGTTGKDISFPPVNMFDPETGDKNMKQVASAAALTAASVNIPDAYEADDFDFSGTKKFDEQTGYRSKSFLTVPLKNSQEEVIGVLQLLKGLS